MLIDCAFLKVPMLIQHPPVAPWLVIADTACHVRLICDDRQDMQVYLRAEPDNEEQLIAMKKIAHEGKLALYEASFGWDDANTTSLYLFKLLLDGRQIWLGADGQHDYIPPRESHFKVCKSAKNRPPTWAQDQIFYQIFPDRFSQGDTSMQARRTEQAARAPQSQSRSSAVIKSWGKWGEVVENKNASTTFYGGDLLGIQNQLSYLQDELGVTALYLNPIFSSPSNHRYDTDDYFNVDPYLGGNEAFTAFSKDLKQRGMRLVLDAVVNHTSDQHPWFNRFGQHDTLGAYQSPESAYRHWYTFSSTNDYCSWKGHEHLPVLDMAVPAVQNRVYQDSGSILRFWMRPPYAIDGWRFDVLHMLGEGTGARNNAHYVREFRRVMHEENPQSYVLGEQFNEATRWLQGEQEDGAMNYYGFAHPVRAWLAEQDIAYHPIKISSEIFERWLTESRARIPYANQLAQLNLLDSHDTVRFFSLLNGDGARMQLAVVLLLTYPGMPCIYYGDEIGMQGGADPDCRRCFEWNRANWDQTLFNTYRALIQLRKDREELRAGAYQTLFAKDDLFVFVRFTEAQATLVALNRGASVSRWNLADDVLPIHFKTWSAVNFVFNTGEAGTDAKENAPSETQTINVLPELMLSPCSAQIWVAKI